MENHQHVTALLHEAVNALAPREDGIYVDGTSGKKGHPRLILSRLGEQGRLATSTKNPQTTAPPT
ncbi:16S rRNA (cytosine(1402)-N(4))-methyltransferase, partial [Neisseria sp. P0022.S010]